jgi:enamine deaminase RidA (YjgF/YER057c/UK114 family)
VPIEAAEMTRGGDVPVHAFLHHSCLSGGEARQPAWRATPEERPGSRFERLMFLGGHADPRAAEGTAARSGPVAQAEGALRELEQTLAALDGRPEDIVKLVIFHTGQTAEDEAVLLRAIRRRIVADPPPVISLVALPRLADAAISLLVKGIAIDNADGGAPRVQANPAGCAAWPSDAEFSAGLRCGEFVFVGAQTAKDSRGTLQHRDDIAAQAQLTIDNIAHVLEALSCDLDDVVKLNTWYVGFGTDEDWRRAAEIRSRAFRFPGPCATGVPVPARYPDGALIRQECLALRGTDGKRLPRALSWPLGHWDWPMRVSFQQGIRVGRLVVLGGQYSMDEKGLAVDPNDMMRQTTNTLAFIRRILEGFGAGMEDLLEVTSFYKHDAADGGAPLKHLRLGAQRAPLTEVPLATMGLEEVTLEVEGFAVLPWPVGRSR